MLRSGMFAGVLVGALLLTGCAYNKETVPLARSWTAVRAANQQRVVALAVDDAVDQLEFGKLASKSVTVEVSGVFPHTDAELLAYVKMQVEGRAARAGARVIELPPQLSVTATGTVVAPAQPSGTRETPDYRLLVGVAWGGIDTRVKLVTDEPRLAGQLGLAAGGVLAGFALQNTANSGLRYVAPGGAGTVSTGLIVGGPAGAGLWALIKPPIIKTTTLNGRVRITVSADPVSAGTAFVAEGEGNSRIVIDDNATDGYKITHDGRTVDTHPAGVNVGVGGVTLR